MGRVINFDSGDWSRSKWDPYALPLKGKIYLDTHVSAPGPKLKQRSVPGASFPRVRFSVGDFYETWVGRANERYATARGPKGRRMRAALDLVGLWSEAQSSKKLFSEKMFNRIELRGALRRAQVDSLKWPIDDPEECWRITFPKAVGTIFAPAFSNPKETNILTLVNELEGLAMNYSNSKSKLRQAQRTILKDESLLTSIQELVRMAWLDAHDEFQKSVLQFLSVTEMTSAFKDYPHPHAVKNELEFWCTSAFSIFSSILPGFVPCLMGFIPSLYNGLDSAVQDDFDRSVFLDGTRPPKNVLAALMESIMNYTLSVDSIREQDSKRKFEKRIRAGLPTKVRHETALTSDGQID